MTGHAQKKFNYVPEQGLLTSCDTVSSKGEEGEREVTGRVLALKRYKEQMGASGS